MSSDRNYAHRSLVEKLGIKAGMKALVLHAPFDYREMLGDLAQEVVWARLSDRGVDFIHIFTQQAEDLGVLFPELKSKLAFDGMLWVSWPKKSSGIEADITERQVMEIGLENGLVDVKVSSINEAWSGLKFIYRLKDRH